MELASLKSEQRALGHGNHQAGLIQRQVSAVYLVVIAAEFAGVFF